MGDLLEYFEATNDGIERLQNVSAFSSWNNNFTSCIRFNGAPILPPVMTQRRREEMLTYRRQAMKLENRRKSKQREQLVAKVQSIVAEVEKGYSLKNRRRLPRTAKLFKLLERRLARTSSSNKSSPQSNSSFASAKVSPDTSNKSTTSRSVTSSRQPTDQQKSRVKDTNMKSNVSNQPQKSKKLPKSDSSSSSSSSSNVKKESEHTAQVKKTTASKIPTVNQGHSLMNLKRSSSLSSLPNLFQVPKPPPVHITKQQQIMSNSHARRANLRSSGQFSFSNPDLRDIGTSDDQSSPSKTDSDSSDVRKSRSKSNLHLSSQQSISNPDISNSGISSESDIYHPKPLSNNYLTVQDSTGGVSDSGLPVERTFQTASSSKRIVPDIDSKGETLESLSDLTSLEDNSLPQDFNGLPLTSERQQKISHVLSKLSRCLNIQDTLSTLNSTNSSQGFASEVNSSVKEKGINQPTEPPTKPSLVTPIDRRDSGGFVPRENKSSTDQHSTPPSHNSSASERLSVGSSGGGNSRNMSGMSSDSSVTGSQFSSSRRMSPKGSKSAVHFASFVTEINTSASLSVEDKILVRKLDITPTNSPHVSLDASNDAILDHESKMPYEKTKKSVPKNLNSLGSGVPQVSQPSTMLDKVALSPDGDSPTGASKEFFSQESDMPFNKYSCEIETSTSDKENEGIRHRHVGQEVHRNSNVLDSVKSSVVSDEGSHTSTLKASQDLLSVNKSGSSVNVSSHLNQRHDVSKQLNSRCGTQNNDNYESARYVNRERTSKDTKKSTEQNSYNGYTGSSRGNVNPYRTSHASARSNQNPEMMNYDSLHAIADQYMSPSVQEAEAEQEGKAEHIQRYLSHVHEQSINEQSSLENTPTKSDIAPVDIGSTIKSFTTSLQSVDNLNEDEMLKIQEEHFSQIRLKLIEQQRRQLEELFVSQRRDQMNLQREIEEYQHKLKQSQDMENSPENNTMYSTSVQDSRDNSQSQAEMSARIPSHDPVTSSGSKAYSYVASPSLNVHPRDRDNGSDISTFSKGTPKQSLVFTNQTTPTPKIHKPVLRSPVKQPSLPQRSGRYSIPEKALDPAMKPCFDRVSACVKGYLTRRLLKTEKVQEIITTIQDTKRFAISFQTETPIKSGNVTHQDRDLLDRIIAQLQASLLDLHEIFFVIPVWERMSIIAQSRQLQEEKRLRDSTLSRASVSSSQPRISSATLKAMERKRKAHEAEMAVFGDVRPVSAPPPSNNAKSSQSIDLRALKPLQGHSHSSDSHRNQSSQPSTARGKIRPKTAPEKTKTTNTVEKQGGDKPRKVAKSGKNPSKVTNVKSKTSGSNSTKSKTVTKSGNSGAWR